MKYILYYNNYHKYMEHNIKVGSYATLKEAKDASIKYENDIKDSLFKHLKELQKDTKSTYTEAMYFDNYWGLYFEIYVDNEENSRLDDLFKRGIYANRYPRWERVTEDFEKFVVYRGEDVALYIDDYGQSYYFRYRSKSGDLVTVSCGSYNPDYDDAITYTIDEKLDLVHVYQENKLYGARLKYQFDVDGIRRLHLTYRLEDVAVIDSNLPTEKQIKLGKKALKKYMHSEPFKSEEKARKKAIKKGDTGKMYFSDLMEKAKKERKE